MKTFYKLTKYNLEILKEDEVNQSFCEALYYDRDSFPGLNRHARWVQVKGALVKVSKESVY